MRNICVIGGGYVGLVSAACFAELGHRVTCVEIDPEKLQALGQGMMPIHEPGLLELWHRNWAQGRLRLTSDYEQGLSDSEIAFIAVGTPSGIDGKPDLRWVRSAAKRIAEAASYPMIVVNKSTVPVGTAEMVSQLLSRHKRVQGDFTVVSNPEFLREGLAVYDFFHPTRVVLGLSDDTAARVMAQLYEPLGCPIIICDARTAEISKYASNAFLATRISFINEIARLCDQFGIDVVEVARVAGMEPGCGEGYLSAGLGWGGSCLPKDVRGLIHMARSQRVAVPILRSVLMINSQQPRVAMAKLQRLLGSLMGKQVGLLGLAFKPNSDDVREASSLLVIAQLQEEGCRVKAYDPQAMQNAAKLTPGVDFCADAYEVADGSHALILVTEWDEFKELDFARIRSLMLSPIIIDGRNFFDTEEMARAGFIYEGVGRGGFVRRQPKPVRVNALGWEAQPALTAALSPAADSLIANKD